MGDPWWKRTTITMTNNDDNAARSALCPTAPEWCAGGCTSELIYRNAPAAKSAPEPVKASLGPNPTREAALRERLRGLVTVREADVVAAHGLFADHDLSGTWPKGATARNLWRKIATYEAAWVRRLRWFLRALPHHDANLLPEDRQPPCGKTLTQLTFLHTADADTMEPWWCCNCTATIQMVRRWADAVPARDMTGIVDRLTADPLVGGAGR